MYGETEFLTPIVLLNFCLFDERSDSIEVLLVCHCDVSLRGGGGGGQDTLSG